MTSSDRPIVFLFRYTEEEESRGVQLITEARERLLPVVENVPSILRERTIWLNWRYEIAKDENGGITLRKPPYNSLALISTISTAGTIPGWSQNIAP